MGPQFITAFKNSVGMEVAGVWFDEERRQWRLSTVPVRGFADKEEAVDFFYRYCDGETGLQTRAPGQTTGAANTLHHETMRARALCRQREILFGEVEQVITEQENLVRNIEDTLAKFPKN